MGQRTWSLRTQACCPIKAFVVLLICKRMAFHSQAHGIRAQLTGAWHARIAHRCMACAHSSQVHGVRASLQMHGIRTARLPRGLQAHATCQWTTHHMLLKAVRRASPTCACTLQPASSYPWRLWWMTGRRSGRRPASPTSCRCGCPAMCVRTTALQLQVLHLARAIEKNSGAPKLNE